MGEVKDIPGEHLCAHFFEEGHAGLTDAMVILGDGDIW